MRRCCTFATYARRVLPVVLTLAVLLVLSGQPGIPDFSAVYAHTSVVSPGQWAGAALFTSISFLAIGRYDAVVHRILATGVPARRARRAGIVAIAISQTTGFGLMSGTLSRWRMLPEIPLLQAARLTAMVAVTFLSGWAVVTGILVLFFPPSGAAGPVIVALAMAGPVLAVLAMATSVLQPQKLLVPGILHRVLPTSISGSLPLPPFPSLGILLAVPGLTLLDTIAACLALQVMMPVGVSPGFMILFPAFLLAFGAGMICGTPAGIGPFEVTLLALLPMVDSTALLAAILGWRLVCYVIPALLGVLALAFGAKPPAAVQPEGPEIEGLAPVKPASVTRNLLTDTPAFAEVALARQGQLTLMTTRSSGVVLLTGETGQCLIALRDPVAAPAEGTVLQVLQQAARARGKIPCLYKCSARLAAAARARGWQVRRTGAEAWLTPAEFDLTIPARRNLRRKLRKAASAGINTTLATKLPAAELDEVALEWALSTGRERGFSMGRYCTGYLAGQKVFLARHNGKLVAFVSFHIGQNEWALDLMRRRKGVPDGTMQALISDAIAAAGAAGVSRLSLAAMPDPGPVPGPVTSARWYTGAAPWHEARGLCQFKAGFAPHLTPQYMAAPNRWSFVVAGFDIRRAITRPPDLKNLPTTRGLPTEHLTGKPNSGPIHPKGGQSQTRSGVTPIPMPLPLQEQVHLPESIGFAAKPYSAGS